MKNLFNKSTKILLGLSVWLVLSSVGMITFAEVMCPCIMPGDRGGCMPDGCAPNCYYEGNTCYRYLSCWTVPDNSKTGLGTYKESDNPTYSSRTYVWWNSFPGICEYTCNSTSHWNWSLSKCVINTCSPINPPIGTVRNNSKVPTSDGKSWEFAPSGSSTACTYHCQNGFHYDEIGCEINMCDGTNPENSVINNENTPSTHLQTWKFAAEWSEEACTYHCKSDFEYKNGACIEKAAPFVKFFEKYKVDKINNILAGGVWDTIMDKLDSLLENVYNLTNGLSSLSNTVDSQVTIPAWAIMAFDATKTNWQCPSWWSPFSEADGRFLMWASSEFGSKWWNNSIILQASQIPPHHHYMFHNAAPNDTNNNRHMLGMIDPDLRYVSVGGNDGGDYSMNSSHAYKDYVYNSDSTVGDHSVTIWLTSSRLVNTTGVEVGQQQPINIMNPYLKVLYCVKI